MDYRIQFVYDDASSREMYASTQTDLANQIAMEIRKCNDSEAHKSLSIHVGFIWKS